MIIGIDIRVLGSGRKSGIEEYTEQLLAHMLPLDPAIHYKLFFASYRRQLPPYPWLQLPNVQLVHSKIPNKILFLSARLFGFPKIDKMLGGVDVFFSPHFFLAPLSRGVRRITTFHDLSFELFPDFFSWRKRFWHSLEMRPAWQARNSDRIIAVSDSTRNDLAERYRINGSKIVAIHSGVAPSMRRLSEEEITQFRQQHQLPQEYLLLLATLEPRKNIIGLIKAFNAIKGHAGFERLHLVIAGSRGWLYKDIFDEINASPYRAQIVVRDAGITDTDRVGYYSGASAFVYPSFFEGFGLPPLEAMACGVPVIAARNSSLPEVIGDAGLLIDPYNISELAFAIRSVLTDAKLKKHLIAKGFDRVQKFSWHRTAEQTLKVLTS